jgi:hypothetical protein
MTDDGLFEGIGKEEALQYRGYFRNKSDPHQTFRSLQPEHSYVTIGHGSKTQSREWGPEELRELMVHSDY